MSLFTSLYMGAYLQLPHADFVCSLRENAEQPDCPSCVARGPSALVVMRTCRSVAAGPRTRRWCAT